MLDDIVTVIWKEAREFLVQQGSTKRNGMGILFMLLIVGVLIPWRAGAAFIANGASVLITGWVPLFMAIQFTTDSFAGERERHTLETLLATRLSDSAILLGKIAASFIFTWFTMIVLLLLQLATVNLVHGQGKLIMFSAKLGGGLFVFSALVYALACSAGVLVSLHASTARQAAQMLSYSILGIFFVAQFGFRALPLDWQKLFLDSLAAGNLVRTGIIAALVLVGLNFLLFTIAQVRFQRSRLILD